MARAGLGAGWRCLFATDIDARKAQAYAANWGAGEFRLADVNDLRGDDLPGAADLAWASFPCLDLSLAGNKAGLDGARSGAFWGFHRVIADLAQQRRAPSLLVLENVGGALSSRGGADFIALGRALVSLGYVFGGAMIDAAHFVPQSRPRLFVVALRADEAAGRAALTTESSTPAWSTPALTRLVQRMPPDLRAQWRWWRLPPPPTRNEDFASLVLDDPADAPWHDAAETARLLAMMSPRNLAKVRAAQASGARTLGTLYRRTRTDANGVKAQRAEIRFDGLAGCLRTPAGGSSRQTVIAIDGARVRTRLLSAREAARLMGLPDDFILPARYNDAYRMLGDGLAAPAVRFLSEHLLRPLLDADVDARGAAAA